MQRMISILSIMIFIPAVLLAIPDSSGNKQEDHSSIKKNISVADLRLAPVLPGPRYVTQNDMNGKGWNSGFMNTLGNSPGYAMLASAVVPGLGQAANRQWWKTAFFVAAEATAFGIYFHRENRGRDGERYYEKFGDNNWSVVRYAQYLINNHQHQHRNDFWDLLTNKGREIYNEEKPFGGIEPEFNTDIDWDLIDIDALREAEQSSLYSDTGRPFSHNLPDYGSQQYYELMSKYFQYGPGWRQWDNNLHDIVKEVMPDDFWYHAQIGFDFNDDLNVARNMLKLIIVNHFVAAFDAYFTQQLRHARVQPTSSMKNGLRPTFGLNYRF